MHIFEKMGLHLALERNRGGGRLEYCLHKTKNVHYLFCTTITKFSIGVKNFHEERKNHWMLSGG